jgi:HPt (histidine-containing phosphotransfer) domain-containing protein
MFLEEATLRVARLRVVQEREDAAAIAGLAHTLKGSGAAFGAGVLSALCAEIEDAVSAHNMIDLARLVDAVAVEFNRVKELLTEELR